MLIALTALASVRPIQWPAPRIQAPTTMARPVLWPAPRMQAPAAMASTRPVLWPSPRTRAPRGCIAMVLGATPQEDEELQALAGVWRLTLDLDDGLREISAQLTADGRVHTTDQALENHPGHGGGARWWVEAVANRSAPAGTLQSFEMSIRIADWTLLATGKREGLRCREMSGSVLEGQEDSCCIGSLAMSLALPAVDDGAALAALEQKLRARLEARPAPPARFAREAFSGGWRMMYAMNHRPDPLASRTHPIFHLSHRPLCCANGPPSLLQDRL